MVPCEGFHAKCLSTPVSETDDFVAVGRTKLTSDYGSDQGCLLQFPRHLGFLVPFSFADCNMVSEKHDKLCRCTVQYGLVKAVGEG